MTVAGLPGRFGALWRRMGASDDGAKVFQRLIEAYRQPDRHYHGLDHLLDCLAQLDAAASEPGDRDAVEAALWFHDAVYQIGATSNETRSADWGAGALREAGAADERAAEVARLVMLTDHRTPASDPAGALVCDVDLSILGRDAAEFAQYEEKIRAEYRPVPDSLYRIGRAKILSDLLARDPIYQTGFFRNRYEMAARRNLERSLANLRGLFAG